MPNANNEVGTGPVAYRVGRLIDGTGNPPLEDATLLIDGDRIMDVGRAPEVTIPSNSTVVDAPQHWLIPGLIDVHVHVHALGGAIANYGSAELRESQGTLAFRSLTHVARGLRMGFTSLRSLGSPSYVDVALRDAINAGLVVGPRLMVAGQGLSVTGGHMDKPTWSSQVTVAGRTGVCDGPDECRRAARLQFKRGADLIKLNACSEAYYRLEPPWGQEMTYAEMQAICEVAHWLGRRVAAHTSGGPGITDAIRAGVDSLEHAHWLDDEQLDVMAERGTFYTPTLIVNSRSIEVGQDAIGISRAEWDWLLRVSEDKWETLRRAHEKGVRIATGSDAGFVVNHGESGCELEELVKGGLTPMEAIVAATRTAADCLGVASEVGTLERGKRADFVMLAADPLENIRLLQDESMITKVVLNGQVVAPYG